MCVRQILLLLGFLVFPSAVVPAQSTDSSSHLLVPKNLLKLIHASEVQQELQLTFEQIKSLERFLDEIDGQWFRSRVLPPEQQRSELVVLEEKLAAWLVKNISASKMSRLRQLELQSQGVRMLLRKDVSEEIGLSEVQVEQIFSTISTTQEAAEAAQQAHLKQKPTDDLSKVHEQAVAAERQLFTTVLLPEQTRQLRMMVGELFGTENLERIYPRAPELIPSQEWINSSPLALNELRGKVVIVHFYAFQCHNCHANLAHYQRWHDKFASDGVVVIGIQTPETAAERDVTRVRTAALDKNITYPVLIDLESKNWTAWSNTMWPSVYVIDRKGYLRQWWQGELNWQGATGDKSIEALVSQLLNEPS